MKRTITLKGAALAMLLSFALIASAQEVPRTFGKFPLKVQENGYIPCASTENELILQQNNPNRANEAQFEAWMAQKIKEMRNQKSGNEIITIPVVVHVIYQGSDNPGFNENISLLQIQSQIDVLNEDYGMMAGTPGEGTTGLGVDTGIRFCLATVAPDGTPTDGVDRYQQTVSLFTTRDQVESVKTFTIWDPEQYLNIWTINWGGGLANLLGYSQFPSQPGLNDLSGMGGDMLTDGVAINYKNFGSKDKVSNPNFSEPYAYGRTTTHEIGHFLGLRHIWGDENGCTGNDYCADTPVQIQESQNCPQPLTDTCTAQPGEDLYQDYMDYSNDQCMSVFTPNQVNRMKIILANSPRRKTLGTSTVCGAIAATPEVQLLRGTTVYPNPAQNVLNITVENGELPDAYTIYNSIGQLITSTKVTSDANLAIDTSSYSNGIYFIKIDKGAEAKTIKFIKN